jgi:hypothetical protein
MPGRRLTHLVTPGDGWRRSNLDGKPGRRRGTADVPFHGVCHGRAEKKILDASSHRVVYGWRQAARSLVGTACVEEETMPVLRSAAGWLVVCVLALGRAALGAGDARAESCLAGCPQAGRACVDTLRTRHTACRHACRTDVPPFARVECQRDCRAALKTSRGSCRDAYGACREACETPAPGTCSGGCGRQLAACAREVPLATRSCARDCRPAADRAGCLDACADVAGGDVEACASAFDRCIEECDEAGLASTSPPKPPKPTSGKPAKPPTPAKPARPATPEKPAKPAKPEKPAVPAKPAKPGVPDTPTKPTSPKPPKPPT